MILAAASFMVSWYSIIIRTTPPPPSPPPKKKALSYHCHSQKFLFIGFRLALDDISWFFKGSVTTPHLPYQDSLFNCGQYTFAR